MAISTPGNQRRSDVTFRRDKDNVAQTENFNHLDHMLRIHHLGRSQSERIVWLCEELGLSYELQRYARDPITILSPPELKALHPLGAAPLIEDGDLLLAESAAIVEYIIVEHGGGRLRLAPNIRTTRSSSTGSILPTATCKR